MNEDGRTIYSNIPSKGAVAITTDPEEKKQGAAAKKQLNTQKARDKQRYDILENELGVELALRQKTQKNIARISKEARPNKEELKTLEEDLRGHENNIAVLQKEMARFK